MTAINGPLYIFENTIGSTSKTSFGLESSSNPNVNNEGNIIRPAKIAIMVFTIPVVTAVLTIFSYLFKYDDRVSIAANPNDSAKKIPALKLQ